MDKLIVILALNGALVLTLSMVAGLFLYLAIKDDKEQAAWHLLHAGGTGRGVMLLALAAIIDYPALPLWQSASIAWLVIFFVWTSMFAMGIRALCGERGLRLTVFCSMAIAARCAEERINSRCGSSGPRGWR